MDELTVKLRKSLTLDDQPLNESFAGVEQSAVETDLNSESAKISSVEHPADDTSAFFDCENKSFAENVLPDNVVDPAADVADNQPPTESEVGVIEPPLTDVTDDKLDPCSTEVVGKMAANFDQPASPPIAVTKGCYTINWDDFDEDSDPFMPKKGLANSPPKSPIVPACVGEGDGKFVDEVDPFRPSCQLTNSPPAAVSANEGSAEKQTQRRSINNNVPEPITDDTVSSPADSVSQPASTDSMSIVSENETPSMDVNKCSEVVEAESTTECLDTIE